MSDTAEAKHCEAFAHDVASALRGPVRTEVSWDDTAGTWGVLVWADGTRYDVLMTDPGSATPAEVATAVLDRIAESIRGA